MTGKRAQKDAASPKRGPGQPSPYADGYATTFPEAAKKLALLGATDADIADFFGIAVSTLALWKTKHPEFSDALKAGKQIADAEVAHKLYQRAMGYEHDEVDIRVIDRKVVMTPIRKIYAPDTTAAIFWLKNRQKAQWRDKVEVGQTDKEGNDVEKPDLLEMARRIAFALAKGAELTEKAHG